MFLMIEPCPPGCCVFVSPLDDDEATVLAVQLKALADPARIKLVSMLATSESGELCACDLPEALGKSQPTVSHSAMRGRTIALEEELRLNMGPQ